MSAYYRPRILLVSAAIICFCIFWWAGSLLDIPDHPGFQVSLLMTSSPFLAVAGTVVVLLACTALGTAVASRVRFDAGLFLACIGLSALAFRGGPRTITFAYGVEEFGSLHRLMLLFAGELLILTLAVVLAWNALWGLYQRNLIDDNRRTLDVPWQRVLAAFGIQVLACAVLVGLIARSEMRQQVLAAVFIGAYLAPLASQGLFPTSPRALHWLAPLVVGLIGYLAAAWVPGHPLATLARPLPLDYASAGPAGAILGHWLARQWWSTGASPEPQQPAATPA